MEIFPLRFKQRCQITRSHCQFSVFLFTFNLCYFCQQSSAMHNLLPNFFVKSQHSLLYFWHLTKKSTFFSTFFSNFISKNVNCFLWRQSAWKGIWDEILSFIQKIWIHWDLFRICPASRENWVEIHIKLVIKTILEIFCVKWQKYRSKCCDFTENLSCTIFDKKKWQETEWTKILRTDSVSLGLGTLSLLHSLCFCLFHLQHTV